MRIVAVAGGDDVRGLVTGNGNVIGDVTFGGTAGLIILGTMVGGLFSQMYVVTRRWLPGQIWLRSVVFGFLAALLAEPGAIDRNNADFFLFTPVLSVAMFASLPFLYGVIQVQIAEWLDKKLPQPGQPRTPVGFYTVAAAIAILSVLLSLALIVTPENMTWRNPVSFVAFGLVYALALRSAAEGALARRFPLAPASAVRTGGYALMGVAAGLAAYLFYDSVSYFLS